MISTYEIDTLLHVAYTFGSDNARVTVIDPAFKSVESDKKFRLNVSFVIENRVDEGWGTVDATGITYDYDGETQRGIEMSFRATEFLNDMARARIFALMRDDIVVESLSLNGSAPAIQALRRCARIVHKENPADPLAD